MGDLILVPWAELTPPERRAWRIKALKALTTSGVKKLDKPAGELAIRDLIVGDEDAGDTAELPVDIQDAPAGTEQRASIRGWAQDASDVTAETLDLIYDDTVHDGQVIGVIGFCDLTPNPDMHYLRMRDGKDIKAFFNTQRLRSNPAGEIGAFFADSETGEPAVVVWEEGESFQIETAHVTAVDKFVTFEAYVVERYGAVLTK